MRAVLLALLVGCAPQAMTTNAQHPANSDAPTGRLAGPPAALRPGVADVSTPARTQTQTPAPIDHAGHGSQGEPPKTEPQKTEPAKLEPAKTDPSTPGSTPKPEAKPPAKKPRKENKLPASKKTSDPEPPKQTPPAHQGHEGHH